MLKREKAWKICDSAFVFTTTQGAKVHVISWAGPGIKARDIPTLNLGSPQWLPWSFSLWAAKLFTILNSSNWQKSHGGIWEITAIYLYLPLCRVLLQSESIFHVKKGTANHKILFQCRQYIMDRVFQSYDSHVCTKTNSLRYCNFPDAEELWTG